MAAASSLYTYVCVCIYMYIYIYDNMRPSLYSGKGPGQRDYACPKRGGIPLTGEEGRWPALAGVGHWTPRDEFLRRPDNIFTGRARFVLVRAAAAAAILNKNTIRIPL